MREILFRGKRVDNGEWVEGHLIWYEDGHVRILPYHTDIFCYEMDESIIQTVAHRIIPETVGQYTGLTDKNGNKIFEGDIVRLKRFGNIECGKIVFNTNTAGFEFWREVTVGAYGEKATRKENLCAFTASDVEIIGKIRGNIQDNPELLEVNKE